MNRNKDITKIAQKENGEKEGSDSESSDAQEDVKSGVGGLGLPPEAEREFRRELRIHSSLANFSGVVPSPIFKQINADHINKILEIRHLEVNLEHKELSSIRKYSFLHVVVLSVLFMSFTYYLVERNAELYKEALKYTMTFIGGLGSGYGLKSFVSSKQK